jgi:broad specificity phosphatase PhoE
MPTLFLIRHGEPELRGVFLGQMDSPLSETGRAQVKPAMANIEVAVTYTSPLRRARETAAYIRSPQLIECADLREFHQGQWTGLTWAEIQVRWPDLASRRSADWLGVSAPGGESWCAFVERVAAVWRTIREGPAPCAIVAHHGVNSALMSIIKNADPLRFTQQYGEVLQIEYS